MRDSVLRSSGDNGYATEHLRVTRRRALPAAGEMSDAFMPQKSAIRGCSQGKQVVREGSSGDMLIARW